MRKFITFGPALVVLITAIATLLAAPAAVRMIGRAGTDATIHEARLNLDKDNILKEIDRAVRSIADAVEPTVVHIAVEESAGRGGRWVRRGQGSGWVFDAGGHIVTNAHVVRSADRIMVQFQDGRTVPGELVGLDPSTDVAVIRVQTSEGLFPAQRATGIELHQGDRVYAFGSPFGFKFSMSEGIISGLGRDPREVQGDTQDLLFSDGMYTNYIQTDAAVNPGNSGGPLVNVDGKVVGMNVAIATARTTSTDQGQSSGISFAIPLASIEPVVEQLIGSGYVTKGYLGIQHDVSDAKNQAALDSTSFRGHGVVVTGMPPGGPASKADIRVGDIIVRVNGEAVTGLPVLRSAIANNKPGDNISVEIWREGQVKTITVTLGTLPPTRFEQNAVKEILAQFGIRALDEADKGVRIAEMVRPSPAFRAGLEPEQRITKVEGVPVEDTTGFVNALAERGLHQGREVTITVETPRGREFEAKISPK